MRPVATLLVVGVVLTAALVGVGSGAANASGNGFHADHVAVDTQVSSNGTVTVETVSMLTGGFVVLHADDDGEPGRILGHHFLGGSTYYRLVNVSVDAEHWREWGTNRTVWAVLHRDDGDVEFEPNEDPPLTDRNPAAAVRFELGEADHDVHVVESTFGALAADGDQVTVERVALSRDGYLVAQRVGADEGDDPLGTTAVAAGHHRNVSIALDRSALDDSRSRHRIRLVAYADDGDGTFGPGDEPVTVGAEPVATTVVVELGDDDEDDGSLVVTPSPTDSPSPTVTPTTTVPPETDTTRTTSDSGAGGFGVVSVTGAVVAFATVALWRRRG